MISNCKAPPRMATTLQTADRKRANPFGMLRTLRVIALLALLVGQWTSAVAAAASTSASSDGAGEGQLQGRSYLYSAETTTTDAPAEQEELAKSTTDPRVTSSTTTAPTTTLPPLMTTTTATTTTLSTSTTTTEPTTTTTTPLSTANSTDPSSATTSQPSTTYQVNLNQPYCTLGDDNFQIGERWNPNLPPFGVQVCVLCECTIRQRKSCYEAKVTCRRITNECPIIDSCPDGKKPVTIMGQCCKTCQSNASQQEVVQQQQQPVAGQSPYFEQALQVAPNSQQQTSITAFKIVYMNERTKDYLSLVESLPACPTGERGPTTSPMPVTSVPATPKTAKSSKNDLNGIDTRLAFKSLHDSASSYVTTVRNRADTPNEATTSTATSSRRFEHVDDSPRQDQQHPNDVQSVVASNSNGPYQHHQQQHPRQKAATSSQQNSRDSRPQATCTLGNETYQVGDIWSPVLPPFGVQVCVQCNCLFRLRKACYETRVSCRRINNECPSIELCPDGKPPVAVAGQCCKSCQHNNMEQQVIEGVSGSSLLMQTSATLLTPSNFEGVQRSEKVVRDFQILAKTMAACMKRDLDPHSSNRYAATVTGGNNQTLSSKSPKRRSPKQRERRR